MRADRLLSIVLLLQNHGKLTSKELARQLEVSERTIMRDMDALSAAGIPVYADRGSNGGWMLAEGYRTTLTGMKATELLSLLLIPPPCSMISAFGKRETAPCASCSPPRPPSSGGMRRLPGSASISTERVGMRRRRIRRPFCLCCKRLYGKSGRFAWTTNARMAS